MQSISVFIQNMLNFCRNYPQSAFKKSLLRARISLYGFGVLRHAQQQAQAHQKLLKNFHVVNVYENVKAFAVHALYRNGKRLYVFNVILR